MIRELAAAEEEKAKVVGKNLWWLQQSKYREQMYTKLI